MAKTATINWELPTTRQSGLPVDAAEVLGTEVALSVVGGVYSVLDPMLPPDILEHVIPDLTPGDYLCRLVPIDTADVRGAETELQFNVPDESPLSAVENASVTVA